MDKANSLRKIALIPAYMNTRALVELLPKFENGVVDEICVVMDCATKNDLDEIDGVKGRIAAPIKLFCNRERRGVGSAIRQGICYALERGHDVVVVIAGNNKDDPSEVSRLLKPILNGQYDYVQGSRFLPGGKAIGNPFLRRMFSRLYPYLWTLLTGIRCTDVTNGFRAYRLSIFSDRRIRIFQDWLDSYQLEYYVHYKVLTLGYRTKEVPVSKTYQHKNAKRYSNISPLRDWWKIVGPLIYLKCGARH